MRKAIDTAPRNGDFVILEDAARGALAFVRWSAEAAQWLDEDGTPCQLNATHWHSLQNLDEEGTPSQINAACLHPLSPAQIVVETVDEIESLPGPSKRRIHRGASRPASGGMAAQPQRAETPRKSVNVWARFVGSAKRGCGKILSAFAVAGNWIVHSRRNIVAMAACVLVGAAFGPLLYSGDLGKSLLHRTASEDDTGLQQALQQERERASKLSGELAATRQEVEAQTAAARAARDEAARQVAETSKRSADEQGQALREAQGKAEKLTAELAATRQKVEAQAAAARAARDEAAWQVAETSKRSADEQGQALREAKDQAEKLETELAAARREIQSQVSVASSARDQAAGEKEAAERNADEQRHALQQERDKTEKLAAELAEAKSSLEAQAKAKAAEEVARDNQLAALRQELQKAKADATVDRDSLETERIQTQRIEQQLASIRETTAPRGSGSVATASSSVGQPSIAASSVPEAPPKAPTDVVKQPTNMATRPTTNLDEGSPQAVRLIARANLLLEQGNIGAARNMFDRAAEMGSTEALFWLAETYDPLLLSARKTFGTQSDIAKARELYGKALAGGVSEAKLRLEALQQ